MPLTASLLSGTDSLRQEVLVNDRHWLVTDEPEALGGTDSAPTPHELLPAALAACVVTTIRMYARHKGWEVGAIAVEATLDETARPQRFSFALHLPDELDPERRARLERVADACAVHRTLAQELVFERGTAYA